MAEPVVPGAVRRLPLQPLCAFQSPSDPSVAESIPGAVRRRPRGGQSASSQPDPTCSTQGPPQAHACIWSPQNGPVSTHKSLPITSMLQKPLTTPLLILRLLKSALLFSRLGSRLSRASSGPSHSAACGEAPCVGRGASPPPPCHSNAYTSEPSKMMLRTATCWKSTRIWHKYSMFPSY